MFRRFLRLFCIATFIFNESSLTLSRLKASFRLPSLTRELVKYAKLVSKYAKSAINGSFLLVI